MISLNLVLAGLRLGLKNRQVGEKWVSDDCSHLCKGLISEKLKEYWSPEQIMGRLELDKKIKISTETAYRFVLQDKAIGGALYKYLRHQHKKYRERYGKNCQVSPRYSLLSKTTLQNISGFLINKSGFKLYQYSKAS
ncbi:hypothetical protein BSPWISOXPB_10273 [uncultured Gammaproteobacteria bacterium]|nr:hypothetical protein BSPWISOXPB_10273 [uncultured Gammaproteobacteria bacterium]